MKKVLLCFMLALLISEAFPQRIGIGFGIGKRKQQQTVSTVGKYPTNYAGTEYYVSSTGNDSNNGTSPATAWKTLAKVNSSSFSPGDAILLNSIDTFAGTITVANSGNSTNPITVSAYGTDSVKPIIYGSVKLTGWTKRSNTNIYVKYYPTADIQQLFVDGVKQQVARLSNTGYNTISGVTSQTIFTTNATSQANNYYAGATVILRMQNYFSETRTVTSSTGSTLTINTNPSSTIATSQSLLILNKLEFLDAPGEFYYNPVNDTCYFYASGGVDPDTFTEVRGSTTTSGLIIAPGVSSTMQYITVKNLDFRQQKESGVKIYTAAGTSWARHITIQNCNFDGQDNYGLYTLCSEATDNLYDNNSFSNINGNAIFGYNVANSTISNNTISNIGLFEKWGIANLTAVGEYNNNGTGIEVSVGGATGTNLFEYNNIQNVGYNGIMWRGQAIIRYNYIYASGMSKSDGGAIYTGSPTSSGSVISHNIIDYVLGTSLGGTLGRNYGNGVYVDENSTNCTIEYNIIMRCSDSGIFPHKPSYHFIRENVIFDCRYAFSYSNTPSGTTYFRKNTLITGSATDDYDARQFLVKKGTTGVSQDSNIYINGFASDLVFNDGTHRDFSGWKTATSFDAAASYDGTDLAAGETQRLIYNNTKSAKTYYLNAATGVKDVAMSTVTGGFTLQPFTSKYVRGTNIDCIQDYSDAVAPTITAFTIPTSTTGLTVTISSFAGSTETTKYLITESAATPDLSNSGWSSTAPTTFTASATGSVTLYAWVRDAAGNISTAATDETTITFDILPNVLLWIEGNGISSGTTVTANVGGNGTLIGGATINQTGSLGKAISFDGTDDYMTIPELAIFNSGMTNDFSVMTRFNQTTLEASNKIFQTEKATTDFMNIAANNTSLEVVVAENNNRRGKKMSASISTGTWYTVVVTYVASTKTVTMYVNGILETTANSNLLGITLASTTMKVGRGQASAVYANFLWETTAVFDKVLSSQEVSYINDKQYSNL